MWTWYVERSAIARVVIRDRRQLRALGFARGATTATARTDDLRPALRKRPLAASPARSATRLHVRRAKPHAGPMHPAVKLATHADLLALADGVRADTVWQTHPRAARAVTDRKSR